MYNELIQKDIDALKREKSNSIKKYNISKILGNVDAIFTGVYFHYKDVPKKKNNSWKKYCKEGKIKKRKDCWN